MSSSAATPRLLKAKIRSVLVDLLRDEPEILSAALEDAGLARAVSEGLKTRPTSRQRVFAALRPKAS
jgi:hypothetical protein